MSFFSSINLFGSISSSNLQTSTSNLQTSTSNLQAPTAEDADTHTISEAGFEKVDVSHVSIPVKEILEAVNKNQQSLVECIACNRQAVSKGGKNPWKAFKVVSVGVWAAVWEKASGHTPLVQAFVDAVQQKKDKVAFNGKTVLPGSYNYEAIHRLPVECMHLLLPELMTVEEMNYWATKVEFQNGSSTLEQWKQMSSHIFTILEFVSESEVKTKVSNDVAASLIKCKIASQDKGIEERFGFACLLLGCIKEQVDIIESQMRSCKEDERVLLGSMKNKQIELITEIRNALEADGHFAEFINTLSKDWKSIDKGAQSSCNRILSLIIQEQLVRGDRSSEWILNLGKEQMAVLSQEDISALLLFSKTLPEKKQNSMVATLLLGSTKQVAEHIQLIKDDSIQLFEFCRFYFPQFLKECNPKEKVEFFNKLVSLIPNKEQLSLESLLATLVKTEYDQYMKRSEAASGEWLELLTEAIFEEINKKSLKSGINFFLNNIDLDAAIFAAGLCPEGVMPNYRKYFLGRYSPEENASKIYAHWSNRVYSESRGEYLQNFFQILSRQPSASSWILNFHQSLSKDSKENYFGFWSCAVEKLSREDKSEVLNKLITVNVTIKNDKNKLRYQQDLAVGFFSDVLNCSGELIFEAERSLTHVQFDLYMLMMRHNHIPSKPKGNLFALMIKKSIESNKSELCVKQLIRSQAQLGRIAEYRESKRLRQLKEAQKQPAVEKPITANIAELQESGQPYFESNYHKFITCLVFSGDDQFLINFLTIAEGQFKFSGIHSGWDAALKISLTLMQEEFLKEICQTISQNNNVPLFIALGKMVRSLNPHLPRESKLEIFREISNINPAIFEGACKEQSKLMNELFTNILNDNSSLEVYRSSEHKDQVFALRERRNSLDYAAKLKEYLFALIDGQKTDVSELKNEYSKKIAELEERFADAFKPSDEVSYLFPRNLKNSLISVMAFYVLEQSYKEMYWSLDICSNLSRQLKDVARCEDFIDTIYRSFNISPKKEINEYEKELAAAIASKKDKECVESISKAIQKRKSPKWDPFNRFLEEIQEAREKLLEAGKNEKTDLPKEEAVQEVQEIPQPLQLGIEVEQDLTVNPMGNSSNESQTVLGVLERETLEEEETWSTVMNSLCDELFNNPVLNRLSQNLKNNLIHEVDRVTKQLKTLLDHNTVRGNLVIGDPLMAVEEVQGINQFSLKKAFKSPVSDALQSALARLNFILYLTQESGVAGFFQLSSELQEVIKNLETEVLAHIEKANLNKSVLEASQTARTQQRLNP